MNEKADLKNILLAILKKQQESSAILADIFAHMEALRLTLYALDARSGGIFQQALASTHGKYAQELARIQAELELLNATVSRIVQ